MIGFMFYSLPYIFITGVMLVAKIVCIRTWQGGQINTINMISMSLLGFLVFQLLVGFLSG